MRSFVLLFTLALSACAQIAGYETLGTEKADSSYRSTDMYFFGTGGNNMKVTIFTKFSEHKGGVRGCGYYISRDLSTIDIRRIPMWFDQATLKLAGNDIGRASFLKYKNPQRDNYDTEALCVLILGPLAFVLRTRQGCF